FLESLAKLPLSSLIYVPGADERWLRHVQSPTLCVVNEPINLAQVVKECDTAVLNATNSTTAEFLLAGTPILNIPLFLEQVLTAHRVVDFGAGLAVAADRPDSMIESLLAVIHGDRYRHAAQTFARKYAGHDGTQSVKMVVSRVEELLIDCGI